MENETSASPLPQEPDYPGLRWFIKAFLAILAFILVLLYGVYTPFVAKLSNDAIKEGDAYRDRALFLESHRLSEMGDIEEFNNRIIRIYRFREVYGKFVRMGHHAARYDKNHPVNREVVETLKAVQGDMTSLNEFVGEMVKRDNLGETFSFVIDKFMKRAERVEERLARTIDKPMNEAYFTEEYYVGLGNTDLPDFLTLAKRIYGLYVVEVCWDNAMAEYIDAAAYYRLSPTPRLRMADLYRDRKWPEFAMMEYLKVIKLEPGGDEAETAFNEIRKYESNHVEAEFHLALAYLLYDDYANGEKYLQRFLEKAPANVRAPKALEVLRHLRAGHDIFIKQYLRDEIWI